MHTRICSLVFCTLCIISGCTFSSSLAPNGSPLLDSSTPTLESQDSAPAGYPKVDVKSAKFKVMHAYQFAVSKGDGVDEDEAKVIAQSEVIFRGYENDYYFTRPRLHDLDPGKWTVEFYPVTKTFREARVKPRVRVTIDKDDGKLKWEFQS
ncbi:MAG: hypothetical protein KC900_00645 [Candidatus Omnitrophica bacterium]|nr:hypothetical protein [Candidatus Omnitrophota bacterium]